MDLEALKVMYQNHPFIPDLIAEIERLRTGLAKHQESEFHPDWSLLQAGRESLKESWAEIERLRAGLKEIDATLRVPAAEYVPAIGDVFSIIDGVLQ